MGENVIVFPAPVVRLRVTPPAPVPRPLVAVEHDGRVYSLTTLLARLPDDVLDELDALVPATAQETWDLVVRRWPLAARAALPPPR